MPYSYSQMCGVPKPRPIDVLALGGETRGSVTLYLTPQGRYKPPILYVVVPGI